MDEIVYTYEDIVTDTSVLNEAPDFFEEGKTICTGCMDDQPQALGAFLFGDNGLSALPHITEKTKKGYYQLWEKIEGVFDMEYEVYEKSEWLHPYIRRSQVYIKIKVEYNGQFKIYRLDENDNII